MSKIFRRFDAPSADPLVYVERDPSSWAWMNNAAQDAPFFAEGSAANNPGTFFVAYQDNAGSAYANRPHFALTVNTDIIDNLFRTPKSMAATRLGPYSTPSASFCCTLTEPGWYWCGAAGDTAADVMSIRTVNEDEVTKLVGGELISVLVTEILSNGSSVVGSGFHQVTANPVTHLILVLSQDTISNFCLYYATRSSYATCATDAFSRHLPGVMPRVPGVAQRLFYLIKGDGAAWDAPPTTSLYQLASSGLNERYGRSETTDPAGENWGRPVELNTPGSGGVIVRSGYSPLVGSLGFLSTADYGGMPAGWIFDCKDNQDMDNQGLGSIGYVALGTKYQSAQCGMATDHVPMLASFASFSRCVDVPESGLTNTNTVLVGDAGWVTADIVSGPLLGNFLLTLGVGTDKFRGSGGTDIAVGRDILLVQYVPAVPGVAQTREFTVVSITDARTAVIRAVDGGESQDWYYTFAKSKDVRVQWLRMSYCVSDGLSSWRNERFPSNYLANNIGEGLFVSTIGTSTTPTTAFFGTALATNTCLAWGSFNHGTGLYDISGSVSGAGGLITPIVYATNYLECNNLRVDGRVIRPLNVYSSVSVVGDTAPPEGYALEVCADGYPPQSICTLGTATLGHVTCLTLGGLTALSVAGTATNTSPSASSPGWTSSGNSHLRLDYLGWQTAAPGKPNVGIRIYTGDSYIVTYNAQLDSGHTDYDDAWLSYFAVDSRGVTFTKGYSEMGDARWKLGHSLNCTIEWELEKHWNYGTEFTATTGPTIGAGNAHPTAWFTILKDTTFVTVVVPAAGDVAIQVPVGVIQEGDSVEVDVSGIWSPSTNNIPAFAAFAVQRNTAGTISLVPGTETAVTDNSANGLYTAIPVKLRGTWVAGPEENLSATLFTFCASSCLDAEPGGLWGPASIHVKVFRQERDILM